MTPVRNLDYTLARRQSPETVALHHYRSGSGLGQRPERADGGKRGDGHTDARDARVGGPGNRVRERERVRVGPHAR